VNHTFEIMPRLWSLIALLLVVVVLSVATAASDADFFEAAFGLKTHLHHSTATTTTTTAVQDSTAKRDELFALLHRKEMHRVLKMANSEKPGQFLGCAEFVKTDSAMSGLQEEFGSGNVRTIASYPESELVEGGFTCFLVQPTSSSVSKRESLLAWFPLPASLKLSRGAHSQLEHSVMTGDMSSLVNSELEVQLGVGWDESAAESILAGLQSLSPASRDAVVTEFSSVMPHMKAWNSLASALQGEKHIRSESRYSRRKLGSDSSSSSCNFDKLVFKSNDEFLFITHMHELADPSCFATVLATVASEPDVVTVSTGDLQDSLLLVLTPSVVASNSPTSEPSGVPTGGPSKIPTGEPSGVPIGSPSRIPTGEPSGVPSTAPTGLPSRIPSSQPSPLPSIVPTSCPSKIPTGEPSGIPSRVPSGAPSLAPSGEPSGIPSRVPSGAPSLAPSGEPSGIPTIRPSGEPSSIPTSEPTHQPNYNRPSRRPIFVYTGAPVAAPTPTAPVATSAPVPTPVAAPVDKAPTFKPTIIIV
jgi:hypothetical protein